MLNTENIMSNTTLTQPREGLTTAYIDGTAAANLAYKPAFVSNNPEEGKKVISVIEDELMKCDQFQISVAFITMGGITPLLQTLKELEKRQISGQILTTNYLNFSEPRALKKLQELSNITLKMYDVDRADQGFHTKGYIFKKEEIYRIIIGSSNITSAALTKNKEWNTKIVSTEQGEIAMEIVKEFHQLWDSKYALFYDDFYENYKQKYEIIKKQREIAKRDEISSTEKYKLEPNSMQVGFITNLRKIVDAGENRALLISATGTGKTYASAFAMRELGFKRVLFLVHRSTLAKQALTSFRKVFEDKKSMGIVGAGYSDYEIAPEEERQVDIKQLVTYPHGQGTDLLKYDIICTNKPMAGVLVRVKEAGKPCGAGILMFRPDVVKDLSNVDIQSSAVVGIDFGSNNTCVYYNAGNRGAQPVQFKNYRSVIVGKENTDTRSIAQNDELLFFTNYESDNGQLKSWLHEHDSRYTKNGISEEIQGGVPVNRPNILVNRMDEYIIETQAGNLHYNMKWLNDDKGLLKKRAFLKSIWLQACAFLYQNKIKPSQINWSYPGSMMEADIDELRRIFEELSRMTPITLGRRPSINEDNITEAEAVCSYALSNNNFGLNNNNMFLGIDVGGSTSDILLLAKNPQKGNQASLFRESSVRLAAGVFFNTVINSDEFRRALLNFHEGKSTKVFVANIQEIIKEKKKAPYYLNSIFDQLKTEEDYDKFYSSIADNAKVVFTLPAYVTGLLLYYSGMLIGKTIKDNNLDNITRVDILSFGKGGRLFHWLRNAASNSTTMGYYKSCLNAGARRIIDRDLEVKYRDEIEVDNKAEVAKGLCDMQDLNKVFVDNNSDICGEIGVRFTNTQGASRELLPTDELSGEYFDNDMNYFDFTSMECFEEFFNIFINFVSVKTKLCTMDAELRNDFADLSNKVGAFICQDSEYKSAKRKVSNGGSFAYHQPLIIAEGSCFLEKTLIKKVFS